MRLHLIGISAILALAGCGSSAQKGYGLWVFQLTTPTGESKSTCEENFTEASCPEGETADPDWNVSESGTESDSLITVTVLEADGGAKFLAIDGQLVPGKADGKTLTFEWNSAQDGAESREHESGYKLTQSAKGTMVETVSLTQDKKSGTWSGTWTKKGNSTVTYSESDTWDTDSLSYYGQIPSTSYLTIDEGADNFTANENMGDTEECSSDPCTITLTQTSDTARNVIAWRLSNVPLRQEDDYTGYSTPGGINSPGGFDSAAL